MSITLTSFETSIKNFLDNLAKEDDKFAKSYAKENKSIEKCCKYIYQEVGKQRKGTATCVGCSDDEIYGLAIHYYDEDDIQIDENAVKPDAVQHSAPANKESAPTSEQAPVEGKKKTRKPRKAKETAPVSEVDPNIPEPFDIPMF